MKVSRSKSEYLCVNGGNNKETVKMDDTNVPKVNLNIWDQWCKKVITVRRR